jgi:hypothetical protein
MKAKIFILAAATAAFFLVVNLGLLLLLISKPEGGQTK